jgi:hypothetical protein
MNYRKGQDLPPSQAEQYILLGVEKAKASFLRGSAGNEGYRSCGGLTHNELQRRLMSTTTVRISAGYESNGVRDGEWTHVPLPALLLRHPTAV